MDEWLMELDSGRPGDNLMLLSLDAVRDESLLRIGSIDGPVLGRVDSVVRPIVELLGDTRREVAVVRRSSPGAGELVADHSVLWDPSSEEWQNLLDAWAATTGELWFFDEEIIWQRHEDRFRAETSPELWSARHGVYIVDGFLPDDDGRVVCGGPY
jgi:hypothetical protein